MHEQQRHGRPQRERERAPRRAREEHEPHGEPARRDVHRDEAAGGEGETGLAITARDHALDAEGRQEERLGDPREEAVQQIG